MRSLTNWLRLDNKVRLGKWLGGPINLLTLDSHEFKSRKQEGIVVDHGMAAQRVYYIFLSSTNHQQDH